LKWSNTLSLNDSVTIFSIAILSFLSKYNIKLLVREPSEEFMKTMIENNKQGQIISLRLAEDHFRSTMELASSITQSKLSVCSL
jgi:hypothetical protein